MHFTAPFRVRGALARGVAFVDDGAVENVFSQGHEEVRAGVGGEAGGFEGGEAVESGGCGGEEGVAVELAGREAALSCLGWL